MQNTIIFLTDAHLGDTTPAQLNIDAQKNLDAVLQDIAQISNDEIVFGGDITSPENYQDFFNKLEKANSCYRILLGNHDEIDDIVRSFKQPSAGIDELYYAHDDQLYRYIYMDSSSSKISNAQLQWLAMQLDTTKKIILFIHHPVLGFKTGMDANYPLENRDAVTELLLSSKQEVNVFCGHYHMADKRTEKNITQYITPATSFQVQKQEKKEVTPYSGDFGYRVIELSDTGLQTYLKLYSNGTFVTVTDDNIAAG